MTRTESDPPVAGAAKRQRIAKLMARAGLCSRRDAEAWVVEGRVSLNGTTLTSPAIDVSPEDIVLVDGAPLPAAEKTRLFLFHKPRGLVTTDHDPEGRETVADYLHENWPEGPRVVTIGRLDINTEGLLLLTNDGGLARLLELPQTGWVRRYRVRAKGTADPAALDALADGVTIDGVDYAGIEAKLDRAQGANTWLTMSLREGKNREIKRVLEHLGLEVNRLIRLSFGPFQLLDLPEGAVEEVRTRVLRDQLGASLAAKAGVDFGAAEAPKVAPPVPAAKPEARRREALGGPRDGGGRERTGKARMDDRRPPPGREHREAPRDAPPKRERPASGPRKHVSALRAERVVTSTAAPRTRVERSATTDRRDRTVKVERLVPSGAKSTEPGNARRDGRRPDEDARSSRPDRQRLFEARPSRERAPDGRRDGNARADDRRSTSRGHASPSATGKRERVARSGARPRHDERSDRREGGPRRVTRPQGAGKLDGIAGSDARSPRRERPDYREGAPRGRGKPSAADTRDGRAHSGAGPRHRTADMPSGRPPHGKPARAAQGRGPTKGPRKECPAGAKPAPRTRRLPNRGGRKSPRGPSKPGR